MILHECTEHYLIPHLIAHRLHRPLLFAKTVLSDETLCDVNTDRVLKLERHTHTHTHTRVRAHTYYFSRAVYICLEFSFESEFETE